MATRLHKEEKLKLKQKGLLELEKGKTNEEVAQLFSVPVNTLFTWRTNKDKIFQAFKQGRASRKMVMMPMIKSTKLCSNGLKGQDPKMFLSVVC